MISLRRSSFCILIVAINLIVVVDECQAGDEKPIIDVDDFLTTTVGSPVWMGQAPGDPSRFFIAQRWGEILILKDGELLDEPFLDLTSDVSCCGGERGFRALAFEPNYQETGRFYVMYNFADAGSSVLERFSVSDNPDVADVSTREVLLEIDQPSTFVHMSGWIGFSPNDGYLYVTIGDGGFAPMGIPAQNPNVLDGSILRLDVVSTESGYAIPKDNPFVGRDGLDEVWAYGVRNPWRASFDSVTGDLWFGDVGASSWEEINFQSASSKGGENYGWNCMEGILCHVGGACSCGDRSLVPPAHLYNHGEGCAIIGGYLYRGKAIPELYGKYIYCDHCTTKLFAFDPLTGKSEFLSFGLSGGNLTMAEDLDGELYVTGFISIHKIVPYIADCDDDGIPDADEIASGEAGDCDGNGLPDECQPDCDHDGVANVCEILDGTQVDLDESGVPDDCQALGDLSGDGIVTAFDLARLLGDWGDCKTCGSDVNGDGVVNAADLAVLLGNWGEISP